MTAAVAFGAGLISITSAFVLPVFSGCLAFIHAQPDLSNTVTCKVFSVLSIGGEVAMFIGVVFGVLALWSHGTRKVTPDIRIVATAVVAGRSTRRRIADFVGAIAMIAAAAAAIYCKLEFAPVSFDAKTWREAETPSSSSAVATRLRMADGLVQSGVLLGKSRGQIHRLLGAPTSTHKFRDYDLAYWLGTERGFMGIDGKWLVFRLDAKGQAAELKVVRD